MARRVTAFAMDARALPGLRSRSLRLADQEGAMRRRIDALTHGTFDLLILGGGITGSGAALDAALRGLRVALIDRGDFASGTSSISSKLVHGGLRYLEYGDFGLVYEALHERRRLLDNAPHLVRPLRFVLPFYQGSGVLAWKWRLGLMLYDLLAGAGNLHRSRSIPLTQLRREFPHLHRAGLGGAAEYYDAQMDDARVCIEVVRTAALHGAVVANYVEAVGFERHEGRISAVRAVDHLDGRELSLSARVVLNATGPWVDAVRRLAGDDDAPLLRPTKGVHLLAPRRGLSAGFLLLHPVDRRVFFVLPWLNKTLIGTTDTDCPDPPGQLTVTAEDERYLLQGHNHYLSPELHPSDVLGRFVGARPLLGARPGEPSDRSREHRLMWSPSGLLTVAGGKYTTYRSMAETTVDAVVHRLGLRRRCRTRQFRLDGAPRESWTQYAPAATAMLIARHGLSRAAARHLVDRYGCRAIDVAAYLATNPQLARPVVEGEPDLLVELAYQREHEMAVRPDDFFLRRTRLGLYRPEVLDRAAGFVSLVEAARG
jgi:glycerol-3-phosphate dehydrogenase